MTDETTSAAAEPAQAPIRVFVVEDQTKILKNQLKLLEGSAELSIIGTALSGETGVEEVRRLKPDVLLLDLGLPRMSGIDVTRVVKAEMPEVEILIFTIFDEEDKVLEAVKAGASGYLLKGTPADKMVEAIKEVRAGGTVIQPSLARRLLKHFRVGEPSASSDNLPPVATAGEPEGKKLSARETEILQLIAKGVSNSEAATMLNLSKATIRTHLEHIYRKLEVTNRVEAVTEGLRKGLIQV
ncbi:MAG: DNA-binding response regulator [Archangium gephyra]|uniref:DNA-binding response regulator n=1 Tax=Archangium gephyra TaxID=48 RepID=A0A2W5TRV6_9BACT|nr:MAG: DNA-binding response regulator [Archangium gephyra]